MTVLQTVGCLVVLALAMTAVVVWRLRHEPEPDEPFDEPGGGW